MHMQRRYKQSKMLTALAFIARLFSLTIPLSGKHFQSFLQRHADQNDNEISVFLTLIITSKALSKKRQV